MMLVLMLLVQGFEFVFVEDGFSFDWWDGGFLVVAVEKYSWAGWVSGIACDGVLVLC